MWCCFRSDPTRKGYQELTNSESSLSLGDDDDRLIFIKDRSKMGIAYSFFNVKLGLTSGRNTRGDPQSYFQVITANREQVRAFFSAAKILKKLAPHDTILRVDGLSADPASAIGVGMMVEPIKFSLKDFLLKLKISRDNRSREGKKLYNTIFQNPHFDNRLSLAKQLAQGLAYIHAKDLVHGRLTSDSIWIADPIVDNRPILKISGFEYAIQSLEWAYFRRLDHLSFLPRSISSLNLLAPETLFYGNYSIHTDIFNFGILLWELFTLENAVATVIKNTALGDTERGFIQDERRKYDEPVKNNNFKVLLVLPSRIRYQIRRGWANNIPLWAQELMIACWQTDCSKRPTAKAIVERLSQI